jgi:hypothetical protein
MNDVAPWRFWGYAATFGALWGAVEITVGSFLHAVRIPLGGVVLAGVGAALLVVMRLQLPERGVVLLAGAVCAGIKLLSPASAVVGPIIAILAESLLVEMALLPFGANVLSSGIAGLLTALWSIGQKLITQTLFFGMPIIDIYKGVLLQAEKVLRLPASNGTWSAALFLCVVGLAGAGLGVTGLLIGRAARRQLAELEP